MQVFNIEKVGKVDEYRARSEYSKCTMSETSLNSWGFGGAVSPPYEVKGRTPWKILFFGLSWAFLSCSGEIFKSLLKVDFFSKEFQKIRKK